MVLAPLSWVRLVGKALQEHLLRHETENQTERFQSVPDGTFALIYTNEAMARTLDEPKWLRLWVVYEGADIVAHASLYCLGIPADVEDKICYGHIGIERSHRGEGLYKELQALRLGYCDRYRLTLTGTVAHGNDNAWHLHRKWGYVYLSTEKDGIRMYREPMGVVNG